MANSKVPMGVFVPGTGGLDSVARLADSNMHGMVVRQETQMAEAVTQALGLPVTIPNVYVASALPADKKVKSKPHDRAGWEPSANELKSLDRLLFIQEESSAITNLFFMCMGMSNLRPLRMHFRVSEGGEAYVVDRRFQCGGECCCPLTMDLFRSYSAVSTSDGQPHFEASNQVLIGRVQEDFDSYCAGFFRSVCLCTHNHNIQKAINDGSGAPKFTTEFVVSANLACCGRTNNWCGATCCKNDAVFVIYDTHGKEVGHIQKTYGGGDGFGALCRCMHLYDNYVIEFPAGATTADDRMLILTSVLQIDYQLFEEKGGGGGGGS